MNAKANRLWILLGLGAALTGLALIIAPSLRTSSAPRSFRVPAGETASIDPKILVPETLDLPSGTQLISHNYVTTRQAAKRNGTSFALLTKLGREIGYDRDFLVPRIGDIEVEVVRFRSHEGVKRAYSYFLTLPGGQGLPNPAKTQGIGDQAALLVSRDASFVEFVRGRYYVVVTSVPARADDVNFIAALSHAVDLRILQGKSGKA